mmetsp:Transcript_29650/g.59586  ORF Transcript_29650/g.59586 Transcript_29650/m.59586 type:complete len:500 (-) Transcript_29650:60-1559(-)
MTMSSINEPCYGILCHRQYVDRVSNALLAIDDEWRTIDGKKEEATPTSTTPSVDQSSKCLLVPTSMEKGPRKSRTGYSLLVLQNCIMSPAQLPPTARRQLSWAGRLSHKTEIKSPCVAEEENNITGKKRTRGNEKEEDEQSDSYLSIINTVASEIWKELTSNGFDIDKEVLRIDAHPKTINSNSEVCLAMQRCANAEISCASDSPIKLALSASVVTTVVSVVFTSQQVAYWGIAPNRTHFAELNQRLNDYATKEVAVEATDCKSGLDNSSACQLSSDTPVSRAYYKLAQVFEDEHLLDKIASLRGIDTSGKDSKHLLLNHGSGLDVGASPGGWSQVLCNQLCIPAVALDPAVLAKRVDSLAGVTHIRAELNSKEAIAGISQHAPYSTIVCDACLSNPKTLIEKIFEALESVKQVLKESGNEKGRVVTFPLCTVFTLKFPHKTTGSIARFIDTTSEALPDYFRRFATLGGQGNVEVTYKICHLFANSISERTVIAVFNKK